MFSANPYLEPMPGTQEYEHDRFEPLVAVHETDSSYEIELDLPEAAVQDVDVRVHAHDIVIRCRHAIDHCAESHPVFGTFLKRVHLEHEIDPHDVRTTLTDGVLEIFATKTVH